MWLAVASSSSYCCTFWPPSASNGGDRACRLAGPFITRTRIRQTFCYLYTSTNTQFSSHRQIPRLLPFLDLRQKKQNLRLLLAGLLPSSLPDMGAFLSSSLYNGRANRQWRSDGGGRRKRRSSGRKIFAKKARREREISCSLTPSIC